jgi:hypothetical protein
MLIRFSAGLAWACGMPDMFTIVSLHSSSLFFRTVESNPFELQFCDRPAFVWYLITNPNFRERDFAPVFQIAAHFFSSLAACTGFKPRLILAA